MREFRGRRSNSHRSELEDRIGGYTATRCPFPPRALYFGEEEPAKRNPVTEPGDRTQPNPQPNSTQLNSTR